jgi:hypothetical protein
MQADVFTPNEPSAPGRLNGHLFLRNVIEFFKPVTSVCPDIGKVMEGRGYCIF